MDFHVDSEKKRWIGARQGLYWALGCSALLGIVFFGLVCLGMLLFSFAHPIEPRN